MVPGFINVAGIDSPGLTSSPAVALMVREIIKQSLKLNYNVIISPNIRFNPFRLPIIVKKDSGFVGRVNDADPNLNIICRCERVTEAEIVDAINRPLGGRDTDMIKRRTRAGMGMCQGSFCEPLVARLISKHCKVSLENVGRRSAGSSILPHRRVTGLIDYLYYRRRSANVARIGKD